jgi:hypothetical protein
LFYLVTGNENNNELTNIKMKSLLNNMQPTFANDEKLAKENYCKMWLLQGNDPATEQTLEGGSGFKNEDMHDLPKSDEQMQREYLCNLLMQLNSEEEQNTAKKNEADNDYKEQNIDKTKKSKRSKSETILTLNSVVLAVPNTNINKNNHIGASKQKNPTHLGIKNSHDYLNHTSFNVDNERRFSFLNIFGKFKENKFIFSECFNIFS